MYICICICIHIYRYVYIHTHTHKTGLGREHHTHTHTYTHTYTHSRTQASPGQKRMNCWAKWAPQKRGAERFTRDSELEGGSTTHERGDPKKVWNYWVKWVPPKGVWNCWVKWKLKSNKLTRENGTREGRVRESGSVEESGRPTKKNGLRGGRRSVGNIWIDKEMNSYSLLHLECHSISFSNLKLIGLFSAERGKRGVEN